MFRGAQAINLDSKGRMAIPTRYRAEILEQNEGKMVCTADLYQPCLLLYTLAQWEMVEQNLLSLSNTDLNERALKRIMIGYATECELDSNGRILLSNPLRQQAGLEKGIMLVGQLNKFEIWSEARWNAQIAEDAALGISGQLALSDKLKSLSY